MGSRAPRSTLIRQSARDCQDHWPARIYSAAAADRRSLRSRSFASMSIADAISRPVAATGIAGGLSGKLLATSGVATTGRPDAIASRTLFDIPPPETIGATKISASRNSAAISGTYPVTTTPACSFGNCSNAAVGFRPIKRISILAETRGKTSRTRNSAASHLDDSSSRLRK